LYVPTTDDSYQFDLKYLISSSGRRKTLDFRVFLLCVNYINLY